MTTGLTVNPTGFNEVQYRRSYFTEYVRTSAFAPYMGIAEDGFGKPIHAFMETKKGGESIEIPIVARLKNGGVWGNTKLGGREEQLGRYKHNIGIEYRRNGIELPERDEHYSFAEAAGLTRPLLMEWSREQLRNDCIDGYFMVDNKKTFHTPLSNNETSDYKVAATQAEKDTWTTNNQDRVLFGNSTTNYNSDWSTAMATVTTAMTLDCDMLDEMKFLAKQADPHIRPIKVDDSHGQEFFVAFVGSHGFKQLKQDDTMRKANREARDRGAYKSETNPMFNDGDLIWDGMIIREVPEIPTLGTPGSSNGPGASSIACGMIALSGAQAVGVAWGMEPEFREKTETDYGHFMGIGVTECLGSNKIQRDQGSNVKIDNGMVTGFYGIS